MLVFEARAFQNGYLDKSQLFYQDSFDAAKSWEIKIAESYFIDEDIIDSWGADDNDGYYDYDYDKWVARDNNRFNIWGREILEKAEAFENIRKVGVGEHSWIEIIEREVL